VATTLSLEELARLYVAKIPGAVAGSGGHNQTFTVACALVKGFDMAPDQARALMAEYNARCEPPWTAAELEHKLNSADRSRDDQPRGWLRVAPAGGTALRSDRRTAAPMPAPKAEFKNEALTAFAARWREFVDTGWLAERSGVMPYWVIARDFLNALYDRKKEKVVIFTNDKSQGQALWPDEEMPVTGREGVWYLAQPVDGQYRENPRCVDAKGEKKLSRRSEESVMAWRYLVIESDEASPRDWLGALVQLPLRIAAIYTSGGRSIHALVRLDAATKQEWDGQVKLMKPVLVTLGADAKSLTAVRLTRLPGCWREGKRKADGYVKFEKPALQKLLYLCPAPVAEPICALPKLRDCLGLWGKWAERLVTMPAEMLEGQEEDFAECVRVLEWFESVPAARELLGKLREWATNVAFDAAGAAGEEK
jgi:hypothetical protein